MSKFKVGDILYYKLLNIVTKVEQVSEDRYILYFYKSNRSSDFSVNFVEKNYIKVNNLRLLEVLFLK